MTKTEYAKYEAAVAEFLASHDVRAGCYSPKCEHENYFSGLQCDCCKRPPAGGRMDYVFRQNGGEIFEAAICLDCEYYLTYGKLDDLTMMAIEASTK